MALTSTVLSTNTQSIYTSVGNNAVTTMYLCNTGNVTAHFSVYAVPSGNSASNDNAIYYRVPLTSQDTYVIDNEKLILGNGDSIYANIVVSGANIQVVATVSTIGI